MLKSFPFTFLPQFLFWLIQISLTTKKILLCLTRLSGFSQTTQSAET